MYLNYGEICVKIKDLMEEFQKRSQSSTKVETIADMKAFVENYPQFKKMSGTVAKHVTLVGELSRLVSSLNLLELSEAEQILACQEDHYEVLQKIKNFIKDPRVRTSDLVRLVSLYSLRYEKSNSSEFQQLKTELIRRGGVTDQEKEFMNKIVAYGGAKFRETDLFLNQNTMAITKRMLKGFKGVDNIYTQHSPLVKEIVEQLIKGKLKETAYPFLGGNKDRPQEIIVFTVGGITYEETCAIHNINKAYAGNIKVVIGGTFLHNLNSFMDESLSMTNDGFGSTVNEAWNSSRQNAYVKKSLASAMRD
jgi:vacuolar protein sorting-associated protein 45